MAYHYYQNTEQSRATKKADPVKCGNLKKSGKPKSLKKFRQVYCKECLLPRISELFFYPLAI